jgi:hypothetical protein
MWERVSRSGRAAASLGAFTSNFTPRCPERQLLRKWAPSLGRQVFEVWREYLAIKHNLVEWLLQIILIELDTYFYWHNTPLDVFTYPT